MSEHRANPCRPTKAWMRTGSSAARSSRRTSARKHEKMGGEPVRLPARHLLALGRDDPRGLPGPGGRGRPCSPSATSTSRTSAPGATPTAAWCGASTTSTRRRRCPTRSTSSGWRPAPCWRSRTGSMQRGDDLRGRPRGLPPGAGRAAGRSCSTATGPGCASCWSSPTSSAPRFWSKIEATRRAPAPPRYRRGARRRHAGAGSGDVDRAPDRGHRQPRPAALDRRRRLARRAGRARGQGGAPLGLDAGARAQRAQSSAARSSPTDATGPRTPGIASRRASILRRLSPNNRKIEAEKEGVVAAHARHAARHGARARQRASGHRQPPRRHRARPRPRKADWLLANAKRAAAAVAREFEEWKAR